VCEVCAIGGELQDCPSAFMIYASLMLEKFPNKGLEFFKYMHTVRMAASRGYSLGWVNYDEQYRLRKGRFKQQV
jgi:hypothetical protein